MFGGVDREVHGVKQFMSNGHPGGIQWTADVVQQVLKVVVNDYPRGLVLVVQLVALALIVGHAVIAEGQGLGVDIDPGVTAADTAGID